MSDKVYKKIELVGTSTESFSAAVKNAVEKAHQAVYQAIRWIQSLVGESLPFRGVTLPTGQFAQSGTISS